MSSLLYCWEMKKFEETTLNIYRQMVLLILPFEKFC